MTVTAATHASKHVNKWRQSMEKVANLSGNENHKNKKGTCGAALFACEYREFGHCVKLEKADSRVFKRHEQALSSRAQVFFVCLFVQF